MESQVEIGLLAPHEQGWLLERSVETGWSQLSPEQQGTVPQDVVLANARGMVTHALSMPGSAALVARVSGRPVGYIVVVVVPEDLTARLSGLFLDIWVDPDYRGQGLASRLTMAGEEHCRSLGLTRVHRVVAAHNTASLEHARKDGCEVERYLLVKRL